MNTGIQIQFQPQDLAETLAALNHALVGLGLQDGWFKPTTWKLAGFHCD